MAHTHTPGPWTVDDTAQPAHMAQCLVDNPTWVAVEDSADDGGHIAYCAPVNAPIIAAAPAMLDALRLAADALSPARNGEEAEALRSIQSAIAAATGTPGPAQSPPIDSDGKRTDTWNLAPGAQPDADEPEALSIYRITETAVYLVRAEDEAHAERRFVCEAGIHAECFHAVEGRTIELVEEGEE